MWMRLRTVWRHLSCSVRLLIDGTISPAVTKSCGNSLINVRRWSQLFSVAGPQRNGSIPSVDKQRWKEDGWKRNTELHVQPQLTNSVWCSVSCVPNCTYRLLFCDDQQLPWLKDIVAKAQCSVRTYRGINRIAPYCADDSPGYFTRKVAAIRASIAGDPPSSIRPRLVPPLSCLNNITLEEVVKAIRQSNATRIRSQYGW